MAGMLTVFFCVSCQSWAQTDDFYEQSKPVRADLSWPEGKFEVDFNLTDNQGYRHGIWIRVYDDESLYYRGEFQHGEPSGAWWFFRKNGTAISSIIYSLSDETAQAAMYNEQGRISATGEYLKFPMKLKKLVAEEQQTIPLKNGKWSFFDEEGRLIAITHFNSGQKHGLEESYFNNGQIHETGQFVDGRRDGAWQRNLKSGLLERLITYENGVEHGPFQASYDNGMRLCDGSHVEGEREGRWRFYNKDGTLHEVCHYEEGNLIRTTKVNGTFTDWYDEDRPKNEMTYRDKMKDGPFREWHDQGEYVIEPYQDPILGEIGSQRIMKGLQISREGEFVRDKLDGAVYHYDTQGRLVKTEHYNMGELIRTDMH